MTGNNHSWHNQWNQINNFPRLALGVKKTGNFKISHINTNDHKVKKNIVLLLDVRFWNQNQIYFPDVSTKKNDWDSLLKISNEGPPYTLMRDFLSLFFAYDRKKPCHGFHDKLFFQNVENSNLDQNLRK